MSLDRRSASDGPPIEPVRLNGSVAPTRYMPQVSHSMSSISRESRHSSIPRDYLRGRGKMMALRVLLLDGSSPRLDLPVRCTGRDFLCAVFGILEYIESDYFGLQYAADYAGSVYWIDPDKPLLKQVKCPTTILFRFAVKFYPSDPGQLQNDWTKYHFALQIKRDLACGTLPCSESTAALMASYIVQSELGDYSSISMQDHQYLSGYKFIPDQSDDFLKVVMSYHQNHIGQTPGDADFNLLDIARRLEMYGMRLHPVKDYEGMVLHISVNGTGLVLYQQMQRINHFTWAKIRKLSFKKKLFLVKLHPDNAKWKGHVEFLMTSRNACKRFWKDCIEHHTFFRLPQTKLRPKRKLFSAGSSYRYSGRTQRQVEERARDASLQRSTRSSSSRLVRSLDAPPTTTPIRGSDMYSASLSEYPVQYYDNHYTSPPNVMPIEYRQMTVGAESDPRCHDYVNYPLPVNLSQPPVPHVALQDGSLQLRRQYTGSNNLPYIPATLPTGYCRNGSVDSYHGPVDGYRRNGSVDGLITDSFRRNAEDRFFRGRDDYEDMVSEYKGPLEDDGYPDDFRLTTDDRATSPLDYGIQSLTAANVALASGTPSITDGLNRAPSIELTGASIDLEGDGSSSGSLPSLSDIPVPEFILHSETMSTDRRQNSIFQSDFYSEMSDIDAVIANTDDQSEEGSEALLGSGEIPGVLLDNGTIPDGLLYDGDDDDEANLDLVDIALRMGDAGSDVFCDTFDLELLSRRMKNMNQFEDRA